MTNALLLVLALSVAPTPPAPTPAARGPWVVVQKDGTRVTFDVPPRASGGRLVGTLRGSGTLVSIPEARVDGEATARANSPGGAAAPVPKAISTPRPFETPPLGDRAKLTKSGEEAQRLLEGARAGAPGASPSPSPSRPPGDAGAAAKAPADVPPVDRLGRGEDYWRARAAALRSELVDAERELAQAEADLESAERAYLGRGEAERTTFVVNLISARDRAERARRDHGQSSARWQALEEEARKSDAFPGWLR